MVVLRPMVVPGPMVVARLAVALAMLSSCAVSFKDYGSESAKGGGGPSPGGGSPSGDGRIGEVCEPGDCLEGLECWRANEQAPGPAGGVCTRDCGGGCPSDSVCHSFGDEGAYCMPTCLYGALSQTKCGDREDMACLSGLLSLSSGDRCVPMCQRDEDCDAPLTCDRRTSLCARTPSGGELPFGHPCSIDDDVCRGVCSGPLATCAERCRIGRPGVCDAEGVCEGEDNLSSDGDAGVCRRSCDCQSACHGVLACDLAGAGPHCEPPIDVLDACPATLGAPPLVRYQINQTDDFLLRDIGPFPHVHLPLFQSFGGTPYLNKQQGRTALLNDFDFGGHAGTTVTGKLAAAIIANAGRTLTLEVVARAFAFDPGTEGALFDIGSTFTTEPTCRAVIGQDALAEYSFSFYLNTLRVRSWSLAGIDESQRHVYHLILDTTREEQAERVTLYIDGDLVAPQMSQDVPLGSGIALTGQDEVSLMNDWAELASYVGALHYTALYTTPLSPSLIREHVAALLYDDDAPATPAAQPQ